MTSRGVHWVSAPTAYLCGDGHVAALLVALGFYCCWRREVERT